MITRGFGNPTAPPRHINNTKLSTRRFFMLLAQFPSASTVKLFSPFFSHPITTATFRAAARVKEIFFLGPAQSFSTLNFSQGFLMSPLGGSLYFLIHFF